MSGAEWVLTDSVERRIRVLRVNGQKRFLDAENIDEGYPLTLDAAADVDLGKIKKAKIYHASINVYTAKLSGELERQLTELSMEDAQLRRSLHVIKQSGSILKRFELTKIK